MTVPTDLDHLIAAAEAAQGIVEKKAPLRNSDKERRRRKRAVARRHRETAEAEAKSLPQKERARRSFSEFRKGFTSVHGSCSHA